MRHSNTTVAGIPLPKRMFAGVLLLLFVALHALSISHHLHHAIHEDAGNDSHACVLTHMADGHCGAPAAPTSLAQPFLGCSHHAPAFRADILPDTRYTLNPGRAPPVSPA